MADLFTDDQPAAPRRTYRPVAETIADVERIREEHPDITMADIARQLGYPPKYLYKLVAQHKKQATGDSGGPGPAAPSNKAKARQDLAVKLCDPLAKVATGLMFAAPTLACVLIDRGEVTARALVEIAEGRPAMLKALENVSKVGPVSDIAETVLCGIIAAAMDFGRIPPEHPLAIVTGNSARYMKMHPEAMTREAPAPPFPFTVPTPGAPVP